MTQNPQVNLDVLHEDNHVLIINKPPGLPTMGVAEGKPSVLTAAKDYIGRKYNKPGNVYLGVVSRLDAPVTGALVIARTSKAAARLSQQFRERSVEKIYHAHRHPRNTTLSCKRTQNIAGAQLTLATAANL